MEQDWSWTNTPTAFIGALDPEGIALPKKAVKAKQRNPVPPVKVQSRYSHLAVIREEEGANEDIPINMVQLETAGEPYPAGEDRIQDHTTGVKFRTGGKFMELGLEYERLSEANGGVD